MLKDRFKTLLILAVGAMATLGANAQMPQHKHVQLPAARSAEVITAVEGPTTYYDRNTLGWYIYGGGNSLQYGPIPGTSRLVEAADGYCYLFNPLTADRHDTYIRCTRQGDKLVAEFPQTLAMLEDITGLMPLYIGRMHLVTTDEGIYYVPDEGTQTVTWTVNADGTMTMDFPEVALDSNGRFTNGLPEEILGTYYCSELPSGETEAVWNAVGDWAQAYTPVETHPILTIPDGLTIEAWQLTSKKGSRMVDIAIDGTDIYISNLTDYASGAIKGTIDGDRVSLPTRQYMGFNEQVNANVWFLSAKAVYGSYDFGDYKMEYLDHFNRTDALVFAYDPAKKTMTTEKDDCYIINSRETDTNYYEYQENPCLTYLSTEGMDAVPQDPVITVPGRDEGEDGYYFECEIPAVNVDGIMLNTDRMYYNIYLNGELHTFYTDTYNHFAETITDIPYNYTDNWDLSINGDKRGIYLHAAGIEEIAVQSVFEGNNGVLYRSARVSTRPAPTGTTVFAYADKDAESEPSGTGKAETYDIAIALTNPALEGKVITAVEIPVTPSDRVSGLSVWIADKLKLELIDGRNTNVVNRRQQVEMPTRGKTEFIRVELDRPYTIPEGGTYVGYSLTVDATSNVHPETLVPIVTARGAKDGGFYIHTSRTFLNWQDRSAELGVTAMTQVWLTGDFLINAATLGETGEVYAGAGGEFTVTVPVHNIGMAPVRSIGYTATVGDESVSGNIEFETPIPVVYAYSHNVGFTLPAIEATGEYTATITIDKVNGLPNDTETSATVDVRVVKFVPEHHAVVEEFTGTWCGWCPRGYVAMEYMHHNYPGFIGVAYHDRDPMQMKAGYPELNSGFPSIAVNRSIYTDPYYAKGTSAGFTLPQLYSEYSEGFVGASVKVSAWIDGDEVKAASNVEWVTPANDGDYRVEYVLVADGLQGGAGDFSWLQHNYYATEPMEYLLEDFCGASTYVPNLTFNDVAILTSGTKGVEGSVTDTSLGHENVYTHTFDISKVLNYVSSPIPFNRSKLRVVALLLDMSRGDGYGVVVNAAQCAVDTTGGISAVSTDSRQAKETRYYDLQGRRLAAPIGTCVISTTYTDGTTTSKVVIIK